jgi:hypothetical protein
MAGVHVSSYRLTEDFRKKSQPLGKLLSLSYVLLLRLGKKGRCPLPVAHNVLGCHHVRSLLEAVDWQGQSDSIGSDVGCGVTRSKILCVHYRELIYPSGRVS